jgi:hypothetical protein
MTASARLHVERTAEPSVLRWVVHDADVAGAGDGVCWPEAPSALARLTVAGTVRTVAVERGDVLVEMGHPASVAAVHAAIIADLGSRAGWLTHRRCPLPMSATATDDAPVDVTACGTCRRC